MFEQPICLDTQTRLCRINTFSCQKAHQILIVQWKLDAALGKRPRNCMSLELSTLHAKRRRKLSIDCQDGKASGKQGRLADNEVMINQQAKHGGEGSGRGVPTGEDPDRFSLLSDDVLAHIFQFLDFAPVCRNVCQTSKRFRQATLSKQFTNSVRCLSISGLALRWFSPISLCRLLSRLGRLRELRFTGCGDVLDDNVMSAIASGVSRHLEKLDVDWCGSVSDAGVKAVTKACPNLVCFTLFKGRSLSNNGQDVTDEALRLISKRCPKLRRLCLTYTQLTKTGIKKFAENTRMVVVKLLSSRSLSWGPTCILLERR